MFACIIFDRLEAGFETHCLDMYTLYYHKDCPECAQQAATTSRLDWLNRISLSTDVPPTGELEKGEIVLISDSGHAYTSGYATRKICLNIPAYFVYGLLLFLPWFLRMASKGKAGCNGDSCDIKT